MPRGPWTRNECHTRARTRDPKLRAHSRATCARKKKGSVSLTCRRLEGERTIAGAERRRQLRSMLFLGFWNSRSPLPPSFSSSSLSRPSLLLSSFLLPSSLFLLLFLRLFLRHHLFARLLRSLLRPLFSISYLFYRDMARF